jgi:hypothetical protein
MLHISLCLCARVCACEKDSVCVCVFVLVGARACQRVCIHVRVSPCLSTVNVRAPYCNLLLHQILRHYLINGTIFEKNFIEYKMCVLIICTNLCKTFLILRGI